MKILKRIAAMGAAVMMMASVSAIGASAADNQFSLYISNSGTKTQDTANAGVVSKNGYFNLNVNLKTLSKGSGIKYWCFSGGSSVGGINSAYSLGNHKTPYKNNTYIRKGDRVLVTVDLQPGPTGLGTSAGGTVSLS